MRVDLFIVNANADKHEALYQYSRRSGIDNFWCWIS